MERVDVVVIGAGFGGLGAALALAEAGARVVVLERVGYPGGCAGTFTRHGARHDAGATLLAGLAEGQVLRGALDRYALAPPLDPVDPVLEMRWGADPFPIPADPAGFVERLCALPGAPAAATRAAFAEQRRIADALWSALEAPELLPPWTPSVLPRLARRAPALLPLVGLVGRPLSHWLSTRGLAEFTALRRVLEPLCRITVQAGVDEVEAPFALAGVDFLFRGVRQVRGGVGVVAERLCSAVALAGGEVRVLQRATGLERQADGWRVGTKRGPLVAEHVVANLAPHALRELLGTTTPRLDALATRVETGWGAVTAYRRLADDALPPEPLHLDLVADPDRPALEGNHVLCSISEGRSPRTATLSTHVRPGTRADVERAQAAMRATVALRAPELDRATLSELPASPRTFARFTGRPGGWVGGVPRRAGLGAYAELWPRPLAVGLWLVGDAVLLGQSTLAAFVGGQRTAARITG